MFLIRDILRVLIIAAHPDDTELGCGGLIHRLIKEFSEMVDEAPRGSATEMLLCVWAAGQHPLQVKRRALASSTFVRALPDVLAPIVCDYIHVADPTRGSRRRW